MTLSTNGYSEVSFAIKVDDGKFQPTDTDVNAPYRVFYDAGDAESDTQLAIRIIVNTPNGHPRSSTRDRCRRIERRALP